MGARQTGSCGALAQILLVGEATPGEQSPQGAPSKATLEVTASSTCWGRSPWRQRRVGAVPTVKPALDGDPQYWIASAPYRRRPIDEPALARRDDGIETLALAGLQFHPSQKESPRRSSDSCSGQSFRRPYPKEVFLGRSRAMKVRRGATDHGRAAELDEVEAAEEIDSGLVRQHADPAPASGDTHRRSRNILVVEPAGGCLFSML